MEQLIILQGISVEQLISQIEEIVEKKIDEKLTDVLTIEPYRNMTCEVEESLKFRRVSR